MSTAGSAKRLYTSEVLGLAVELAQHPLADGSDAQGSARSQSCGSSLDLGLSLGSDGRISDLGLQVAACAIGQASAALFARQVIGKTAPDVIAALPRIEAWLIDSGEPEPWYGLQAIETAREFPARHGAILLPWRAAADALSKLAPPR